MLQHIVKLTPDISRVVETIRKNSTRPEFQELPVNEQHNYIVNMILRHKFEELEEIETMHEILLSLELVG